MSARDLLKDAADAMDWNPDSQLSIVLDFIDEHEKSGSLILTELEDYLNQRQDDENDEETGQ